MSGTIKALKAAVAAKRGRVEKAIEAAAGGLASPRYDEELVEDAIRRRGLRRVKPTPEVRDFDAGAALYSEFGRTPPEVFDVVEEMPEYLREATYGQIGQATGSGRAYQLSPYGFMRVEDVPRERAMRMTEQERLRRARELLDSLYDPRDIGEIEETAVEMLLDGGYGSQRGSDWVQQGVRRSLADRRRASFRPVRSEE